MRGILLIKSYMQLLTLPLDENQLYESVWFEKKQSFVIETNLSLPMNQYKNKLLATAEIRLSGTYMEYLQESQLWSIAEYCRLWNIINIKATNL